MTYHIWLEAIIIQGGISRASYIGESDGDTFEDAVRNWYIKHPSQFFDSNTLSNWGCRHFKTEDEANQILKDAYGTRWNAV